MPVKRLIAKLSHINTTWKECMTHLIK